MGMKNSRNWAPLLILVVIVMLGGATSPAIKLGIRGIPPIIFVAVRFAFALMLLLPFALKYLRKLESRDWWELGKLSFWATANILLFVWGIKDTSAIMGQTLYVGVPVLTIILSQMLKTERLSSNKIIGVVLGLLGSLMIILLPAWEKGVVNGGSVKGNILIMLAVISYTVYTVKSKIFQSKYRPMVITTTFSLTTLGISLLLLPIDLRGGWDWLHKITWQGGLALAYVGFIGTGAWYWLYQELIKKASPTIASFVFYLMPIASFVWAWLLLGEKLSVGFVLGAVLVLLGAWLASKKNNEGNTSN